MLMELVCGIELQNYGQGHILCSGCEYRTVRVTSYVLAVSIGRSGSHPMFWL